MTDYPAELTLIQLTPSHFTHNAAGRLTRHNHKPFSFIQTSFSIRSFCRSTFPSQSHNFIQTSRGDELTRKRLFSRDIQSDKQIHVVLKLCHGFIFLLVCV